MLYQQLREKTLQTLKGASKVRPREEWEFVIRNARLYNHMGCDFLALDLVHHWEFLGGLPTEDALKPNTSLEMDENGVDYRKYSVGGAASLLLGVRCAGQMSCRSPPFLESTGEQPMKKEDRNRSRSHLLRCFMSRNCTKLVARRL